MALGLVSEDVIVDTPVAGPAGEALLATFVARASFGPGALIVA